jgi:hypothetical protein
VEGNPRGLLLGRRSAKPVERQKMADGGDWADRLAIAKDQLRKSSTSRADRQLDLVVRQNKRRRPLLRRR